MDYSVSEVIRFMRRHIQRRLDRGSARASCPRVPVQINGGGSDRKDSSSYVTSQTFTTAEI